MNQPTEDRFRRIEERLSKLERQTEPIQITRLEIDSGSMHRKLDEVQEDTNTLKIQMEGVRADVSIVKANQSDLREYLEEQFKSIGQKQEAHAELIDELINVGEDPTKRFDRIDERLVEQGQKLDLILKLLQPRGE